MAGNVRVVFLADDQAIIEAPSPKGKLDIESWRRFGRLWAHTMGAHGPAFCHDMAVLDEVLCNEKKIVGEETWVSDFKLPLGKEGFALAEAYLVMLPLLAEWIELDGFSLGMTSPKSLTIAKRAVPLDASPYLWPAVLSLILGKGDFVSVQTLGQRVSKNRRFTIALRDHCPFPLKAALNPERKQGSQIDLAVLESTLRAEGWID